MLLFLANYAGEAKTSAGARRSFRAAEGGRPVHRLKA
jgi:hypothetical protein